jgi:hypothetical protein
MEYLLLIPLSLIVWIAVDVARALLRKKMRPDPNRSTMYMKPRCSPLARATASPTRNFSKPCTEF